MADSGMSWEDSLPASIRLALVRSRCRLCGRRGMLNARWQCGVCRVVQTGLFAARSKYGEAVAGKVGAQMGLDLSQAKYLWTTLNVPEGAFAGLDGAWFTEPYMEIVLAKAMRTMARNAAVEAKYLDLG